MIEINWTDEVLEWSSSCTKLVSGAKIPLVAPFEIILRLLRNRTTNKYSYEIITDYKPLMVLDIKSNRVKTITVRTERSKSSFTSLGNCQNKAETIARKMYADIMIYEKECKKELENV